MIYINSIRFSVNAVRTGTLDILKSLRSSVFFLWGNFGPIFLDELLNSPETWLNFVLALAYLECCTNVQGSFMKSFYSSLCTVIFRIIVTIQFLLARVSPPPLPCSSWSPSASLWLSSSKPQIFEESIRKVLVMPGTVLLREGSPGDSMIVISKGPDKMFCLRWRSCRLHFEVLHIFLSSYVHLHWLLWVNILNFQME